MPPSRSLRSARSLVLLALLVSLGETPTRTQEAATGQRPRLLVVVSLDQFRAEYLTTFSSHWRAGMKTLVSEGAVFTRAAYPYFHSDTCAGHFTIGTGALPRTHGMVADNWWDPESRRAIECTDDDQAQPVSYGRASKLGKSARRLRQPTLADALRDQQKGSQVVSLSMKARSAIGMAGNGGDAVTWFEETAGVTSFMTSRAFAARPVPAVQAFLDANPIAAEVARSWTLRDDPATYRHRDAGVGERPPAAWTGLFPHDFKIPPAPAARGQGAGLPSGTQNADGVPDQVVSLWRTSPFSDAYLGRMAIALSDAFELGRRAQTDFLAVGFSATDIVGHAFGPESRELEDTVARLDDTLGELIAHLDAKVGRSNYVLALSADHGAGPVPATRGAGRVATEDVRERIEETLVRHFGPLPSGRYVVSGSDFIRLADGARAKLRAQPHVMRELTQALTGIPGVDRLLVVDELSDRSSDPIVRAAALSRFEDRIGDLVLVIKPNWQLLGRAAAMAATHGTPHPYDTQVPLVLLGAGIKPGRYTREATPADIAPTLARLAGIALPNAEGRVLEEAIRVGTN
jgi:predicted AlkP superfamily pyrophosphatase or phosphodiesterase